MSESDQEKRTSSNISTPRNSSGYGTGVNNRLSGGSTSSTTSSNRPTPPSTPRKLSQEMLKVTPPSSRVGSAEIRKKSGSQSSPMRHISFANVPDEGNQEPKRVMPMNPSHQVTLRKPSSSPPQEYLDRQHELKKWIESVIERELITRDSSDLWNFQKSLQDGVAICQLMLKLKEKSVPHVHVSPKALQSKENILFFISAVEEYGVARHRQFQVRDLSENHNFFKVVECLEDLAFVAESNGFTPTLPLYPEKQTWSEKDIQAAEKDLKKVVTSKKKRYNREVGGRNALKSTSYSNARKSMAIANHQEIRNHINNISSEDKKRIEKGIVSLQAFVRGRIARRLFQRRLTDQAYRSNVAQELLQTEKTYLKNLEVLLEVFYHPLKEACNNGKPIVKQNELRLIFSDSLEVILNYNRDFCTALEKRLEEWSSSCKIGDVFTSITQFLKVYTQYVKDFSKSNEALDSIKASRPKFAQYLIECKDNPRTQKSDLPSYLILPIQRIPRYVLLLTDLLKHTWADHLDYDDLKKAHEQMTEVANYINERKRESDNLNKIWEIEKKLSGKFESLTLNPSRRLIREDTFTIVVSGEPPKDRLFFLFNDLVLVTKESSGTTVLGKQLSKTTLKVKYSLSVKSIAISPGDTSGLPTSFLLMKDKEIVMKVFATSKEERDSWIAEFQKGRDELLKNKQRTEEAALKQSQEKAKEAKEGIAARYQKGGTGDAKSNLLRGRSATSGAPPSPTSSEEPVQRTRSKTAFNRTLTENGEKASLRSKILKSKKSISGIFNVKEKQKRTSSEEECEQS